MGRKILDHFTVTGLFCTQAVYLGRRVGGTLSAWPVYHLQGQLEAHTERIPLT